jgi:hypothetical protein
MIRRLLATAVGILAVALLFAAACAGAIYAPVGP